MEVSKLSETQLLNLKEEIEREVKIREFERLDSIKRKDSVKNIIKEQDRINDFIKKGSGIVDGIR